MQKFALEKPHPYGVGERKEGSQTIDKVQKRRRSELVKKGKG